jgi:MFS transporter, OPA family, sugar phosphate sensor protein UhpC
MHVLLLLLLLLPIVTALLSCTVLQNISQALVCVHCTERHCVQGIGAPACAMMLTRWFSAEERGFYWGAWNISTNLGGFASPLIVGEV